MQSRGISSMAARVECGADQDSGVAMSSRMGRKRRVKARPTTHFMPGFTGFVPRIQVLRSPFFSITVVKVALDTWRAASTASLLSVIRLVSFGGSGGEKPRHESVAALYDMT